jgi:hypothetical protein
LCFVTRKLSVSLCVFRAPLQRNNVGQLVPVIGQLGYLQRTTGIVGIALLENDMFRLDQGTVTAGRKDCPLCLENCRCSVAVFSSVAKASAGSPTRLPLYQSSTWQNNSSPACQTWFGYRSKSITRHSGETRRCSLVPSPKLSGQVPEELVEYLDQQTVFLLRYVTLWRVIECGGTEELGDT